MRKADREAYDRETIRRALICAIGWEEGLAEANYFKTTKEGRRALREVKRFRALRKRMEGTSRTPIEERFKDVPLVPITEIWARTTKRKFRA
jgi:hypothetical protein